MADEDIAIFVLIKPAMFYGVCDKFLTYSKRMNVIQRDIHLYLTTTEDD